MSKQNLKKFLEELSILYGKYGLYIDTDGEPSYIRDENGKCVTDELYPHLEFYTMTGEYEYGTE